MQLFSDLKPAQSIYVTALQLENLLEIAHGSAPDAEVWAELAKVPLEPLAPARSLYSRLRALLVDCAVPLREEITTRSGAQSIRWIEPGMAVTMDYRGDRLNAELDQDGVITAMRCG